MHPPAAFLALLLLAAAASCAPAGAPPDACADVRGSSLRLSRAAKRVFTECDRTCVNDTNEFIFEKPLSWMVGKGLCDPGNLKHKSAPCVERVFSVLSSYKSALTRVSQYPECSVYASGVRAEVDVLREDVGHCLISKGLSLQQGGEEAWSAAGPLLQCHYVLDRLYSFSILAARVFAEGDPARHAQAAAHTCA